jgi:hypothetical protein
MNQAEYEAFYRQARKITPQILRQTMTRLAKIYSEAAKLAAAEVRGAELAGLSELTSSAWRSIEIQLQNSVAEINTALTEELPATVLRGAETTGEINETYLDEALEAAGASAELRAGAKSMFRAINESIVRDMANRIYADGYTLSERIWRAATKYEQDIKDVILSGIAQGRDPIKIAKDIQVYVKDGKIALANRYGRLERGTVEFMKRIGNRVDYRALRLIRTELYTSVREATRQQGHNNPGATDEYDWILEAGRQNWDCRCPELASASPYKYQEVPSNPHPSCSCDLRPRLRDYRDFERDLKTWLDGGNVDYLDSWAMKNWEYIIR